jgi:hypothetical protein
MRILKTMSVLLAAAAMACGDSGSSKVFSGADKIIVTSPGRCTKVWYGSGDSPDADFFMFGRDLKDPGLTELRVFAAVFYENPPRVSLSSDMIQNPQDAVWVWHSGLVTNARAADGRLRFTDGSAATPDGSPASTTSCDIEKTCPRLRADKIIVNSQKPYFFSMWAWDSDRNISHYADEYIPFCWTDMKDESGKYCDQMDQSYCTAR